MTVSRKIGLASAIMMVSVFLSRVIGLVREMVIAHFGGTGGSVDVYLIAFVIPDILNHVVASGFLSITFIPIFSRYLAHNQEGEGWRVFSVILSVFGTLLLVAVAVAWVLTPVLIGLIAPGLKDPQLHHDAVRMTRIILPAQLFFFGGGLLMAVQYAKERFLIPALAPLIYNLGIITGGVLLGPRMGMDGFCWGVLIGAFLGNGAIQLVGARRVGMRFFWRFQIRHPEVRTYIRVTLPLMFGLTMLFSTEFFLKFFGSYLPRGDIASLNYGLRVMLILAGLFGQAVGTATFPFMARLVAEQKLREMNRLLNDTLRYLALVMAFAVLLMVLRTEVISLLFQRGRFDAAATRQTADALLYLLCGAAAFTAQTVVVRGFYAMQDTLIPALYGTIAVLVSLPLYYLALQAMGIEGVALALSVSATLQVVLIYQVWNRRTQNRASRQVYRFYGFITLLSAAVGVGLEAIRRFLQNFLPSASFPGNIVMVILIGILFAACWIILARLFDIHQIRVLWARILPGSSQNKS